MDGWISRTVAASLLAVSVLTSGPVTAPSRAQAPTVDPQSLVGEWPGEWRSRFQLREITGKYLLAIDRVEGDTVYGKVEGVSPQGLFKYPFRGTLLGNTLKFTGGSGVSTELVVTGNAMRGSSRGGPVPQDISVTKTK